MKDNRILSVTNDVKWVGVLDFDIVTFDIVMSTEYGTTYNSYFINAEKKAIVETAKEKFKDVFLNKIKEVVDPAAIEYIILDHTEPDHSGCVKHLLKISQKAIVVGSGNAIKYMQEMVGFPFKSLQVKDGDTLSLGNKTLRFIAAPNLHWPDSIYTYLQEDKVLFTCDSFGAHFCNEQMFDDLVGNWDDAFTYYFDVILKPFSKFMLRAIERIRGLEIDVICPGHGPILRSNWKKYVGISEKYAKIYLETTENSKKNVLITYISAYGYTKEMANSIKEGLEKSGEFKIELADIETMPLGELESKIVACNSIIVGSPTINQNTLLPVYKLFALINPIRDKGKVAAAFGSYGWSGEAVKIIENNLRSLKLNVATEGLALKFYPDNDKASQLVNFGKELGKVILAN